MRVVAILITIVCSPIWAQWDVGTSIELTGSDSTERQVVNATHPVDLEDGVPAASARDQKLNYAAVNGGSTIQLTLSPAPSSYTDGLLISFTATTPVDSGASVNVNGLGNMPLLKNGNVTISTNDIRPNRPYSAIYSNGAFRLLSSSSPACPFGFEIITRDYCIESDPSPAANWYGAAILCMEKGARLCTMGEWMRACKKLDLTSSITAWEWIDSAGNHSSDAKVMGLDPVNGTTPDCEYGRTRSPYLQTQYRCCYSR